jgi:hypothetical protein
MTIDERRKYLRIKKKQYVKAGRKEKGRLLDEMVQVTGYHRKYVIQLMGGSLQRVRRRNERGRTYGADVDHALWVIYEALDYICAERLQPSLVWMAEQLARHGELRVSEELLGQLGRISISTVERRLRRMRQDQPRLPRKPARREKALLRGIPMGRLAWDLEEPGHFEVDLVHHCGVSTRDVYMCTMQWIDVATGWSERRAVLGRSRVVMEDAFRCLLGRLPFEVLTLHPDNDSAFFNYHMLHFWQERVPNVTISRSRPYQKNDNPRVEQKNRTLVRAYLGYERLDTVAHVLAANRLFDRMWVYYNLFQPVMHLKEKQVILREGRAPQVIRRHDVARTPFDRLCETDRILPEHRKQLEALRAATNPRQLREEILQAIDELLALPGATPGQRENVYHTLAHTLTFPNPVADPLDFSFQRTVIQREAA